MNLGLNTFTSHTPAFFDNKAASSFIFIDKADLLTHDSVSGFKEHDGFSHFAISVPHKSFLYPPNYGNLMAIYDEGKVWFVVGSISNCEWLELPAWHAPIKEIK